MIRSNLRLKLLGLSAMLLGLMAFASGAQAKGVWMVNGVDVTSTLLPPIQIKEIEELKLLPTDQGRHLVLLTKIAGAEVKILCTGAELVGVKLETEGRLTTGGQAKFTGCETFLNGTLSAACVPKSKEQPAGTVLSEKGKGLMGLFEVHGVNQKLTEIKPEAGENFAVLKFSGECSLPESVPVKGSLFIKDCLGALETESLDHLIEVDNLASHIYVISLTVEHEVELHGSVIVAIKGEPDNDKPWSGLAK
jgi:hypothetical protein